METHHTCPRTHTRVSGERSRFPPCRSHQDPVLVVVPPPWPCALRGLRLEKEEPERSPRPSPGKAPGCPLSSRSWALFRPLCAWEARPAQSHPLLLPSPGMFLGLSGPCTPPPRRVPRLRPLQPQSARLPSLPGPAAQHRGLRGLPHLAAFLGQEAGRRGPVRSPASLAGSGAMRPCVRILGRKEELYLHKTRRASLCLGLLEGDSPSRGTVESSAHPTSLAPEHPPLCPPRGEPQGRI